MILHRRPASLLLKSLLFLLIVVPLLGGCNPAASNTEPGVTRTATPSVLASKVATLSPAELTATALATPIICPAIHAAPASTKGWAVYKDSHYPFQVSIPPGWKAGAFTYSSGDGSYRYYQVLVLPPGRTAPLVFESDVTTPENIELTLLLSGPVDNFTSDPSWTPEANKISIENMKTTLYDRTSPPDCGEVDRTTDEVSFGPYHYNFYMKSTPEKAKNDIALFEGMMQSFVYKG